MTIVCKVIPCSGLLVCSCGIVGAVGVELAVEVALATVLSPIMVARAKAARVDIFNLNKTTSLSDFGTFYPSPEFWRVQLQRLERLLFLATLGRLECFGRSFEVPHVKFHLIIIRIEQSGQASA